jgi:hypothetical protein
MDASLLADESVGSFYGQPPDGSDSSGPPAAGLMTMEVDWTRARRPAARHRRRWQWPRWCRAKISRHSRFRLIQMADPHYHRQQHDQQCYDEKHSPECTGGCDGKIAVLIFMPGIVLMIVGTSLFATDAVYPLCITGCSLILAGVAPLPRHLSRVPRRWLLPGAHWAARLLCAGR